MDKTQSLVEEWPHKRVNKRPFSQKTLTCHSRKNKGYKIKMNDG